MSLTFCMFNYCVVLIVWSVGWWCVCGDAVCVCLCLFISSLAGWLVGWSVACLLSQTVCLVAWLYKLLLACLFVGLFVC